MAKRSEFPPTPQILDRVGVCRGTAKYLRCLQELYGVSGVLPQSFIITRELEEVEEQPFNGGGYSYVYKATYKGEKVVVKALKIDSYMDPSFTRTVGVSFTHQVTSHPTE